jgi:hypothetical protein
MSIDPVRDDLLTLSEAAALLPRRRRGAKVAVSTLWRWYARGSRGIRLEVARVGGGVFTTRQAIRDFVAARTGTPPACPQAPIASPRSRHAMRELDRMGL